MEPRQGVAAAKRGRADVGYIGVPGRMAPRPGRGAVRDGHGRRRRRNGLHPSKPSGFAPAAFVVANWFGARRGLAMGVTLGGTTTGGMLMTLTASYVIAHRGWRTAYLAFAAPVFLIVIPSVLVLVRSRPSGERQMSVAEAGEMLEGFETAAALRTRSLWMIVLAQFLWAFATTGSIIHLIQYLIDNHYRAATAANLVSLIFGLCTLGKVVMGFVADCVTARVAATLTLTLNAVGVLLLLGVQHVWVILPLMATYGFLQAAPLMLFPLLTAESMG